MKKSANIFWSVGVMLAAAFIIFPLPAYASAEASGLIVDTSFVKDKVGKPGWVLMDVRFPDEYAAGHLPGAVLLPGWISKLYADDTKRVGTVLPRLEKAIGEMGIANDNHVIVYGAVARTAWAEQIRQRIAERREELRLEQEAQQSQGGTQTGTQVETAGQPAKPSDYQSAIRALMKKSKDQGSNDNEDG